MPATETETSPDSSEAARLARLQVLVTPDQLAGLRAASKADTRSVCSLVRQAVDQLLADRQVA